MNIKYTMPKLHPLGVAIGIIGLLGLGAICWGGPELNGVQVVGLVTMIIANAIRIEGA